MTAEPINTTDDAPIEELELSVRSYKVLRRAGISRISELAQRHESELRAIPNFDVERLDEVTAALARRGATLRDSSRPARPDSGDGVWTPAETPRQLEEAQSTPIDELELSVRTYNILKRAGLGTLERIRELGMTEIAGLPGLGLTSFAEIEQAVTGHTMPSEGAGPDLSTSQVAAVPPPPSPRAVERAERRNGMVQLVADGWTMRRIAERFDLTVGRVQQILNQDPATLDAARKINRQRVFTAALDQREEILASYRAGDDPQATATRLGLKRSALQLVIDREVSPEDRAHRRVARRKHSPTKLFSDGDLLSAIREVGELLGGRAPSSNEYAEHARDLGLPSVPTIHNRFGGWRAAVERAGYVANEARRTYTRRWDAAACLEALSKLTAELGEVPTVNQYELIASGRDDLPSPATVRNRVGPWSEVTLRVLGSSTTHPLLDKANVAPGASSADRQEQVWLAHLEGTINDAELDELCSDGLFRWDPSYGDPPDGIH